MKIKYDKLAHFIGLIVEMFCYLSVIGIPVGIGLYYLRQLVKAHSE